MRLPARLRCLLRLPACLLVCACALLAACAGTHRDPAPTPESRPSEPATSEPTVVPVGRVQGAGHESPRLGQRVVVEGVVTALEERPRRFFVQGESDGDPATSDGLCVLVEHLPRGLEPFAVGRHLRLVGEVTEPARDGELSLTCLRLESFEILAAEAPLPEPVTVGRRGRAIPGEIVDDDGLSRFEPERDGIDFFESLEGMRVRVPEPVVVGPTSRYGEAVVVADGGADASPRSARGGLLQGENDPNPERFLLSPEAGVELGALDVGDRLDGDVVGTLGYGYGIFRLLVTEAPPTRVKASPPVEVAEIRSAPGRLTVGSFNLLNVSALDPQEKVDRLARVIVEGMGAPDLLCVQEMQDDSGPEDDGTVSAELGFRRLVEAIAAHGGPTYEPHAADPIDKEEGGRPGANIRVGFLYRPDRLVAIGEPERLDDPAFRAATREDWSNTRRPLTARFRFGDQELHAIGLHLRSKGGDDRVFGSRQPPIRGSEPQRTEQAKAVRRLVDELFDRDPGAHVIVLGDLNETSERPPLHALTRADDERRRLHDLALRLPIEDRYSFVYRGEAVLLDHVLVSDSLARRSRIDVVHCCADRAADGQASDHDPLVLGIDF